MSKFERILFPIDFSERSRAAAPFVLSMAQRYKAHVSGDARVAAPAAPLRRNEYDLSGNFTISKDCPADLRQELQKFTDEELPKVDSTCVVEMGDPANTIADYAANENISLMRRCRLTVTGIFRRALLGSVTAKVLHDAKMPMWTAAHAPEPSHRAHPQPQRILVCARSAGRRAGMYWSLRSNWRPIRAQTWK